MSTRPDPAALAALGLSGADLGAPEHIDLPEVAEGRVDLAGALTLVAAIKGAVYLPYDSLHDVLAVAQDRAHLVVSASDLLGASPPEAIAELDADYALIRGEVTLLLVTDAGPVVVAWSPKQGATVWDVGPEAPLPDVDLPPPAGNVEVPAVTASLLGAVDLAPDLRDWLNAHGALPSGLHRLAAVGHLARYWAPTTAAARRAALDAVFAGEGPPGVAAVHAWAASLDAAALDALETLADAFATDALARVEELADLDDALDDHDDAVAALCADRELLAGLLLALGTLGRGARAAAAVALLDAAASPPLRAAAALVSPLSPFEAERSDTFEDDAWWVAA